jgi:dTDP-4-amino-4,6-dideoxygalactose transaminase
MIPLNKPVLPDETSPAIGKCINSGWLGYGPACRSLENRFTASRNGWALATSTCTSALWLAAQLCRRTENDEVIVPAVTFVSTGMAFLSAGFKVRLADVDAQTLLVTRKTVEQRLSQNTRAIVVVHLYGQRVETKALRQLCDETRLSLIEDCAHRLDLLDPLPPAGDYACYSFNAVKEAPCGEGGLLWGRDPEDEHRARAISNVGLEADTLERSSSLRHGDYRFGTEIGLKLRLNDVLATLAGVSLDALQNTRRLRELIFARYNRAINSCSPYAAPLIRQEIDSFLMYIIRLNGLDRDRLRQDMANDGVATSTHYPSLTEHPLLKDDADRCVTAAAVSKEILTLPCFLAITPSQQEQVVTALSGAIARQTGRPLSWPCEMPIVVESM